MNKNSSHTDKILERIKTGERTKESKKKRKLSKTFLVVDGLIILLIIIFFMNRQPEQDTLTSKINYKNINFRFSVNNIKVSGNYIFTLSITSLSDKKIVHKINGSVGTLAIIFNDRVLIKKSIGNNLNKLELEPEEIKTMATVIESIEFDELVEKNKNKIVNPKKTLIQFDKPHLPLTAKLTINLKDKIATSINFKYGVE